MVVARGQGRLCIVMECGTSESKLGSVHSMLESATLSPYCQCPKDREAVSVKVEGPPYSCLLSTCLSSGSRIPIEILKSSISFSRGRDRVLSSCASTVECTTETLPGLFQCSTRTHIGWAARRWVWSVSYHSMLVWCGMVWKIPPKVAMPAYTVVAIDK